MERPLTAAGVQILPYDDIQGFLKTHNFDGKVWVDGRTANQAVYRYKNSIFPINCRTTNPFREFDYNVIAM